MSGFKIIKTGYTPVFQFDLKVLLDNASTEQVYDIIDQIMDVVPVDKFNRTVYEARRAFSLYLSYSIPDKNSVNAIATFIGSRKTIDAGAGRGLWSFLLKNVGVDITPVSIEDLYYDKEDMQLTWTPVKIQDCIDTIKNDNFDCLFMSWGQSCAPTLPSKKAEVLKY